MSQTLHDRGATAGRGGLLGVACVVAALGLVGCASQQMEQSYAHGKEHFSQKKYGHASPKMVADGQAVPKGGGQYLVGRPYHVAGRTYVPTEMTSYSVTGMSSWYGAAFHGRRTANGEVYDMGSITAAHPTMPLPSYARVTNLANGYSVIVRVNDRGPYHAGRVMDVSSRTADVLDFKGAGTAKIKVDYVGPAPIEGTSDSVLLASLRTDGSAAHIDGVAEATMVADNQSSGGGSLFGALFGSPPSPPPQAPEPAAVRAAPPPPPPPEPVRVAVAEPPRPEPARPEPAAADPGDAPAPPEDVPMHRSHEAAVPVPLPPPRPFDLGAARSSTAVALAAPSKTVDAPAVAVLPPRRPDAPGSAEKALYFADPSSDRVRRLALGALARVRPSRARDGGE